MTPIGRRGTKGTPEPGLLVIDGSQGEGGGQILRTALTLAVLTQRPTRVENIRARRSQPGLRPQHLTAVRAAAAICEGELEGDELGSRTVLLVPTGSARAGEYVFDVAEAAEGGSAGSVALILQTLLLPLALAGGESSLTVNGGTHVAWAPSGSYLQHVFLPTLDRMGVRADAELVSWGFYPSGGGTVQVHLPGRGGPPRPVDLSTRGALRRVWGIAAVTNLPSHIPQRMANRAANVLSEESLEARVEARRLSGAGPGAGIFLFVEYEGVMAGFSAYGRKGLPAERVAEAACGELLRHHQSGAPVDPHLADQLVVPMAVSEGESRLITSEITPHLLTNVWVVGRFLDRRMSVAGAPGEPGTLVVQGERDD